MRPLSLHTSALNDAEYTLFTDNLNSLLDAEADDPESQTLTVREVRAWMRGRYPGIPTATIDAILALLPSRDTINGGEFFAAQRLVLHVEAGNDLDRALAFVQVHPGPPPPANSAPFPAVSAAAPPPPPAARASSPSKAQPAQQRHNPFSRSKTMSLSAASAPVLPPRRVPAPAAPAPPPPRHPPLPPRSLSPPKPTGHVTSTLMKQSLQASKAGQWLKQGQARLEQERVLQVLRSSSSTPRPAPQQTPDADHSSSSESSRGRYPTTPSASSLEQVARAAHGQQRSFDDIYGDEDDDDGPQLPPPTHPDRTQRSAPPSISSRTSASASSSSSHLRSSPERGEKPRPPPKPRSLTSVSPFDATPPGQTRLTRSASLRPSPPPVFARPSGRVRPESVHALFNGLGSLRLGESPFGDPVRSSRAPTTADREALVSRSDSAVADDDS
ncbi:hypothetical protein HMN09_00779800 [Mycena chlorophos]|uniref:Uncharacterized protein n=1 Tax=Mycena chlorophos TaxID=658473 RepID=A0A8H6STP1_MYCCL|nr:hypothetical protein HMN09_00779800 [Mycena chlorophos]